MNYKLFDTTIYNRDKMFNYFIKNLSEFNDSPNDIIHCLIHSLILHRFNFREQEVPHT